MIRQLSRKPTLRWAMHVAQFLWPDFAMQSVLTEEGKQSVPNCRRFGAAKFGLSKQEKGEEMAFLWFATVGWAWLMSYGLKNSPFEAFGTFIIFLIGFGPLGLQVWYVAQRASKWAACHAAMLSAAGVQAATGCDHAQGGTGIALNKQAKTLTLLVRGFWKTYAFDEVREWETRKEQAGQFVGGGLMGVAAAHGNDRRAAANTGLFVIVKDVDNPKWRIEMKDDQTQARWMEILRQELNER